GDAGFELAFDRQHVTTEFRDSNPWAVSLDVNQQTIDGRPNPNFGRPYLAMGGTVHRDTDDSVNARATAFLKHDFSKKWGWLGRILGQQQLTGFYTDWHRKNFSMDGIPVVFDPAYFIGRNNDIGTRNLSPVVYLGPSLAAAASPAGANLRPLQGPLEYPSALTVRALRGNTWQTETYPLFQYPDWERTASSVSKTRSGVISWGEVWQGTWLDGMLVSTLGWRHDEIDSYTGNNNRVYNPATGARFINEPHTTLSQAAESDLFSQGYALRLPKPWRGILPWGLDLTLYHNRSENFQVTGFRQNLYAEPIDPQSGTTKEWGAGLEALDGKLALRVTKFRTVQDNQSDGRVNFILDHIFIMEQRVYETNTQAQLDAAGYVSFKSPNAGPLLKRYAQVWQMTDAGPHANGFGRNITAVAPVGLNETTSSISEGWEYDLVYNPTPNWRMLFNLSEATAARGAAGANLAPLVEERMPIWFKDSVRNLPAGQNYNVGDFAQQNIINRLNTARLSEGQLNPELRRWRANLVTNYDFPRTSLLKGWNVGGAVRWEDKMAIGYAVINDPQRGVLSDPRKPFFGPDETTVDFAVGYRRSIFRGKVDWKIQLNVRNLLNENLLIPLQSTAIAVGETEEFAVGTYRIGAERSFILTSTFSW
ncbi:MAG TPA: hypothetical protein VEQ65_12945, partial [Opitutus sp.]|nr:hypothetical protein [Opitutus sp.]